MSDMIQILEGRMQYLAHQQMALAEQLHNTEGAMREVALLLDIARRVTASSEVDPPLRPGDEWPDTLREAATQHAGAAVEAPNGNGSEPPTQAETEEKKEEQPHD